MTKYISVAPALALLLGVSAAHAETISADVWVDNWFTLYVNGQKVKEDSVPITTERSFNKESFSFSVKKPYVLGFIAKDFKQNDTGLEYIGTPRQQMGDGGMIAQFKSGNHVVAVTNGDWKCLVTHHAPIDKSCAKERNPQVGKGACASIKTPEPQGWSSVGFDDSSWPAATVHSAHEVGPKDGYDQVRWVPSAEFIWGPDLHQDNTILCRLEVK